MRLVTFTMPARPPRVGALVNNDGNIVDLAAAASYRLTTIRQPLEAMVQETVDILSHRINTWSEGWETRQLACTAVERASIAEPPPD